MFQEYLLALAEWETELFSELVMHVDCYELIRLVETTPLCNTAIHLLTATNGLDDAGVMTSTPGSTNPPSIWPVTPNTISCLFRNKML
jgi:hypothetical protein